ncbi:MAG: GSCFA domain-containing protein [Ginsengibacter sp.]
MELLLPFHIKPSAVQISYADKILFMGSCFTEEIGKEMSSLKYNILQNPNGILYDPLSISSALNSYIENKKYCEDDLIYRDELWHSWNHHSIFSNQSRDSVLQNINHSQSKAHQYLKEASWLIMTLGSSYKYFLVESGQPVANCHKAPSQLFQKKLLPTELIISELSTLILNLQLFNPNLKIIFTISPVRHVRDGVVENNRSKARLIEAVHFLKEHLSNVFYFPAYELVIDVLRDYRFYKEDHVHPTALAIAFVFENFCKAFINDADIILMHKIKTIIAAINHKPFHEESDAYKKFKKVNLEQVKKMIRQYPAIGFSEEEKFFT